MTIQERISYVIPIAVVEDTSGIPILVYEFDEWSGEADIAFGVFFIGLHAGKDYIVAVKVLSEDHNETLIAIDSDEFMNKRSFRVSASPDGETVVSASLKVNFDNVKVENPGIYEVQAVLIDASTKNILSVASSFFDIKPTGMIRNEFR
ncbi:hypothetical protein ACTLKO_000922 [Enterobacter ludwigii]|uniref:hypothetical protein n=1 Tax=Enterobacter ludwigii TaxID=299767 RepID=UPI0009A1777D|nr:hypothetical protein [Enterobacter ludwigii]MDW5474779.1 hypothetical protein [Enterobacter ludwigii]WLK78631.1 hypothetical protein Q8W08_11520 [Enterobacter ludwigii]